jgi:hypothetical protein
LVNPDDTEELALTLEGKKKKLTRAHFERFGNDMDLNKLKVYSNDLPNTNKQLSIGLIVVIR